ncbi:MAG TPA: hypothetical protein VFC68_02295, partial [Treponemataceae bacterium]|nr:hypothetical protein [Treponemataceae bacterium]
MILVNRRLLIVLMVLTTFLLIFCGFYSWYILMQSNAMEALQLKLLAEQVLFIAIICSTVNY